MKARVADRCKAGQIWAPDTGKTYKSKLKLNVKAQVATIAQHHLGVAFT